MQPYYSSLKTFVSKTQLEEFWGHEAMLTARKANSGSRFLQSGAFTHSTPQQRAWRIRVPLWMAVVGGTGQPTTPCGGVLTISRSAGCIDLTSHMELANHTSHTNSLQTLLPGLHLVRAKATQQKKVDEVPEDNQLQKVDEVPEDRQLHEVVEVPGDNQLQEVDEVPEDRELREVVEETRAEEVSEFSVNLQLEKVFQVPEDVRVEEVSEVPENLQLQRVVEVPEDTEVEEAARQPINGPEGPAMRFLNSSTCAIKSPFH
ncbi:hypothetical protein H8959_003298 [Pygathrix nigripes]